MVDKIENPYTDMKQDVLSTHLTQLAEVVKGSTEIDVKQIFGIADASISKEDQVKIDQHDSLTSKVDELSKVASAKDLTDNEVILSQASIDRAVSDIKKIDVDAPLSTVLDSKFNNLDKLSILKMTEDTVSHYVDQVATIKKEVGAGKPDSTTQTFGEAPASTSGESAASIIAEMLPAKEDK